MDNLECSNRMLVPELDLIIARSWNRQNDVTVTLNIARKNETFKKSVVWGCKQAAKISIRLEYSNRMLVRELNWSSNFDGDLPEIPV